jgi:hypothetical protein
MAGFGIDTGADIFGVIAAMQVADTSGVYKVENWTKTPAALNSAYAVDSNGDPAAATYYGGTGGNGDTAYEVSYDLKLVSGSAGINGLALGAKGSGYVMRSANVSTENGGWPTVSVSGRTAVAATDTANMGTWTLPAVSINGRKKAQAIGFTVGAGCRLQGASVEASCDEATQLDSQGVEAAYDIANGILTGNADFVEVTAAAAWTMDTTIAGTVTQAPGQGKGNTEYGTTSASYEKVLTRS